MRQPTVRPGAARSDGHILDGDGRFIALGQCSGFFAPGGLMFSGARRPAQNLPRWYPDTGPRYMLYRTPDIVAEGFLPVAARIPVMRLI